MKHIEINILTENVVIESNICNYFVKKSYLKREDIYMRGTFPSYMFSIHQNTTKERRG